MNLWFILSKQNNKQSKAKPDNETDDSSENTDSFTNLPDKEGLNAVADLLLDPKTGRLYSIGLSRLCVQSFKVNMVKPNDSTFSAYFGSETSLFSRYRNDDFLVFS